MMLGLAVGVVVAATPASRLFIASGAKTKAEAEKLKAALVVPTELRLTAGYPKLIESKTVAGLNPGFFLVVLGACADSTAAQTRHGNGLAALIQRSLKGAYAKGVAAQPEACPLWVEPTESRPAKLDALLKSPDDPKLLFAVASELHQEGGLVGASILLRRATAKGATDEPTIELLRTVEFVLEDAPFRLPQ
ncbi:MAG: hypothetical protein Q8S33_04060 [Myxococcales bacterium]|nr:hypothetical protein [Myxococcales bacterium]